MDWNDLMQVGMQRLYAMEAAPIPALEKMEARARGPETRTILQEMLEAGASRTGRVVVACSLGGWPSEGAPIRTIEGWRDDVREFALSGTGGVVDDAMILSMLLKLVRIRTACYEAVYVLSQNLRIEHVAELLSAPWSEDREMDVRIADALATLVLEGGESWDAGFKLR